MNRDELRKMAEESHRIWFKRWIKKNRKNFENKLMIAAKKGYKSASIYYPVIKIDSNLRNRLLDVNTKKYLKDEFNDIDVNIYEQDGLLGRIDRTIIIEFKF